MSTPNHSPILFAGKPLRAWWPMLLVIGVGVAWAQLFYFQESIPPFEDAAMLLRYSEHLAASDGIVWNVGEKPVDGATDFLYMVLVAALVKLGLVITDAARMLGLVAHGITVILVYRIHLRQPKGNAWAGGMSALVVATGPGLMYCQALFGTAVFALAGLITFSYFLRMFDGEEKRSLPTGFAIAGILTGLIRPEGVILVIGMLMSLLWFLRGEIRKQLLKQFVLLFCLPGIAYFAWHWRYFGYPLPNPFYVKGGGSLYLPSLKASFIGVVKMGLILMPLFSWAAYKKDARRKSLLILAPVILFAVAWIFMSNEMNFAHRFQYILMPIMWVAWLPMVQWMRPGFVLRKKWLFVGIPLAIAVCGFQFMIYAQKPHLHADGRAEIGTGLAQWRDRGYTMAVTEAGNLPLFSQWNCIDTWGLNDSHIAHSGTITGEYLTIHSPELIMIHDYSSPRISKLRPEVKWAIMTDTLENFIQTNNYELVACWGRSPNSTHYYYLLRDFPDYLSIKSLFINFPYRWYEDGELAQNFLRDEQ